MLSIIKLVAWKDDDMANMTKKVDNPLTLIAYFAGISESITLAVIPILAKVGVTLPAPLVWFAVLFPVFIVMLFFATLNFNHRVLYAPSDFSDEEHFLSILKGDYVKDESVGGDLKSFWKPDGRNIDKNNEKIIRNWMIQNGLNLSSISAFLYSRDKQYVEARENAIKDLGIR